MTPLNPVFCRRCSRPLSSHLSARAGIGARCAQFEAVGAAGGPPEPAQAPDAASAAVAAIAAALHGLPDDVLDGIVAEAGPDGARILAGLSAWMIRETDGGPAWLRELGLKWAREAED